MEYSEVLRAKLQHCWKCSCCVVSCSFCVNELCSQMSTLANWEWTHCDQLSPSQGRRWLERYLLRSRIPVVCLLVCNHRWDLWRENSAILLTVEGKRKEMSSLLETMIENLIPLTDAGLGLRYLRQTEGGRMHGTAFWLSFPTDATFLNGKTCLV